MTDASARILVARELAALRRAGFSVIDSLSFIAPALPAGTLRTDADTVLSALKSGGEANVNDPVLSLVARGDAASADSLDAAAVGLEAADSAKLARASASLWLTILVAGPLIVGALVGWWRPDSEDFGAGIPLLSRLLFTVADVLKWIGIPLAIVLAVVAHFVLRRAAPGIRELSAASSLLQYAAAVEAGVARTDPLLSSALQTLTPDERQFFEWRKALTSAAEAARILAEELTLEGHQRTTGFASFAPVAGFGLVAFTALVFSVAMYLPIFSLAGAIR